jgi:hypothetical protein
MQTGRTAPQLALGERASHHRPVNERSGTRAQDVQRDCSEPIGSRRNAGSAVPVHLDSRAKVASESRLPRSNRVYVGRIGVPKAISLLRTVRFEVRAMFAEPQSASTPLRLGLQVEVVVRMTGTWTGSGESSAWTRVGVLPGGVPEGAALPARFDVLEVRRGRRSGGGT